MIIDIHGHITSPALFKRFPMPPALADIDGMIETKLKAGVGLTIVGSPVGEGTMVNVPGLDNYAQPPEQLKAFHGWLAETVAKYPKHLRAYAYTNPFGGDALLQSTAQTVKDGGFVGLIVNTSVKGQYLDAEGADSFFAMAAELDVPILLHPPAEPVGSASLSDFRLVEQVARISDVTTCMATLAFCGRLEKYPTLRFIGVTGGGAIALILNRLDLAYKPRHWAPRPAAGTSGGPPAGGPPGGGPMLPQFQNKTTQPPSTYITQMYVDTANFNVMGLMANIQLFGAEHMLFGSDSPPLVTPLTELVDLIKYLPVSDAAKQKIFSGNARRLFKLGDEVAA